MLTSKSLILSSVLIGAIVSPLRAQVMTHAEAAEHTLRVSNGFKSVSVGDTAETVVSKMGKAGTKKQLAGGNGEQWLYFTGHYSYVITLKGGVVISKESELG